MEELISKYTFMAFIHRMVSAGSPKKSAGRAAFSSVGIDMGVAVVAGVAGGTMGLNVRCLWGLGLLKVLAGVVMVVNGRGGGEDGCSSSLESSKSPKACGFLVFDMLVGKSCS